MVEFATVVFQSVALMPSCMFLHIGCIVQRIQRGLGNRRSTAGPVPKEESAPKRTPAYMHLLNARSADILIVCSHDTV